MPIFFLDSSALVKRYQDEEGSARVNALIENTEQLLIARLAIVEVSAALVRRARFTRLPVYELTATLSDFDRDLKQSFRIVELDDSVMIDAVVMARKHGLRGADAIQLACALLSSADFPQSADFCLVSADDELNAAATAEGLRVENPNRHA
jgi:uncharacterized protein